MRILIVEDDFVSRKLMAKYLAPFGECDIAVDGQEAIEAFKLAWEEEQPYDLITLDIMMPRLDGQAVLSQIREYEEEQGVSALESVKIVMTTALEDHRNIMKSYENQCEAYLIKPIDKNKLVAELKKQGIL